MGAKNGALKAFAAAILSDESMEIRGVPNIEDISRQIEIIEDLGAKVVWNKEEHRAVVDASGIKDGNLTSDSFRKIRGGMALTGVLLARFGEVRFPEPGGCAFGQRPIDRFLKGFKLLGADVSLEKGEYRVTSKNKRLQGNLIIFTDISVVATETLMMAATLAEGQTRIVNAACEPEIPNLANYLNQHGAKISGAGTHTITIEGVKKLSAGTFGNIPDRLEAGFFAIAAAATGGDLKITNCRPKDLNATLEILSEMETNIEWGDDWIKIDKTKKLKSPRRVKTHEFPGFSTDQQPFLTVLLTQSQGASLVFETVHEGRLNVVDSLNKMGADIIPCDPHRIIINGPTPLYAGELVCLDARTANAFLLAGMIAEGKTTLTNIYQLNRGFENLPERLNALGARIKFVND